MQTKDLQSKRALRAALFVLLLGVVGMTNARAQEVIITLNPGWTWFSYPRADTMSVATALQSIPPTEGDMIKMQDSYASYTNGQWVGELQQLIPGKGFMYNSMNANPVTLVFDISGCGLPTVTTAAVTKSGDNIISGGEVVSDGGSPVIARGICYSNLPYPDLSTTFTENGTGTGSFTSVIDATMTGTVYVCAYATNENGTAYGDQVIANIDYLNLPTFEYNGLTYIVAPDPQPSYMDYYRWDLANAYCQNLTAYGYSDWRMPTIGELELMYINRVSIGGFVQGNTTYKILYHSSTTNAYNTHYHLNWWDGLRDSHSVYDELGYVDDNYGAKFRCHVRPVRVESSLPSVTTNIVTNISQTSATCGGNVNNNGGLALLERGVCWSTSHNPTTNNNHTDEGTSTGGFTSSITNLNPGTLYYVRAYATNNLGTAYGNEMSFTTKDLPTISTYNVTNITTNSATCGGYVSNEGSGAVTARGICWNTSPNPTINNNYTNEGTGTGSFSSNMTGLTSYTTYYVRAYATNDEGTAYGNQVSFTTKRLPTVTTNSVTNVAPYSATCGGHVTNEGSSTITARGVCWSTNHNPTTSSNHTNDGAGTGIFSSSITGLTPGTQYYVRAYATNSDGTSYGIEMSFTTPYLMVTTNIVTDITQTSANCGGYVTTYGGATVTERGVCLSTTNPNPTVNDFHVIDVPGTGSFTIDFSALTPDTYYYVRAYAKCNGETVYGGTILFKTTKFEYRISEGGVVATSAGGFFYDSGGPSGYFGSNEQYIMTFKSNQAAGTKIQMAFTEFSLYQYSDACLMIYDGMNTSAPLIGAYHGSENPGTVSATNSDGALTFVFISNNYGYGWGWKAAISIVY